MPRPVPDTVGRRPMFIGAAHPALPALARRRRRHPRARGRAARPRRRHGPTLGPEHAAFVAELTEVLDAPAAPRRRRRLGRRRGGRAADLRRPARPGRDARRLRPRWLSELNTDPRHRAAAGLGTEVVRLNQERYMQAAWEQVGDVLAANALLDRARLMQRVAERIHDRHVRPLLADACCSLTAAGARRVRQRRTRARPRRRPQHAPRRARSTPGFRRLMSPRSLR